MFTLEFNKNKKRLALVKSNLNIIAKNINTEIALLQKKLSDLQKLSFQVYTDDEKGRENQYTFCTKECNDIRNHIGFLKNQQKSIYSVSNSIK
tara:strand:- start:2860 stop:3138 length:279 start_codon:yes stop_codon:yes gene_type:complete